MAQVLPPEDDFDAGIGPAGSHSCLYFRAFAWDSDTATPPFGTGLRLTFGPPASHLYSGWWTSVTNAAMTGKRTGSPPNVQRHGCFVFRGAVLEDVNVSASVRHSFSDSRSPLLPSRFGAQGIGCRIRGGFHTGTNPQQSMRTVELDGYWFLRAVNTDDSASGVRWILLRVNGGVITVLAQNPAHPDLSPISTLASGAPYVMRMTAETVGATVRLRGFFDAGGSVGLQLLVLEYDDTSASRIALPGRIGIMGGYDNNADGFSSAPIFDWLQAIDMASGDLVFRDEFFRRNQTESLRVNEVGSFVGRSMAQQFFGDLWGTDDPPGLRLQTPFDPSVSAATWIRCTGGDLPATRSAYFLSQRVADDNVNQDRSIDFMLESTGAAGTTTRRVSVVLRESGSSPTGGTGFILTRGYDVRALRIDDTGFTSVQLWRKLTATSPFVQIGVSSETIPLDTWMTLRGYVENVVGPNFGFTDTPAIRLFLDGSHVLLGPADTPVPGVFFGADGTVYDETQDRIVNGQGEGFGVRIGPGIGRAIRLDNWRQGADAQPGTTPEDQQETIPASREADGAFGELGLPADWPVVETVTGYTVGHEFESGHVWRGLDAPASRRRWIVTARAEDVVEIDYLRAFAEAHRGVEIPFVWRPPPASPTVGSGSPIVVRFASDVLSDVLRDVGIGGFEFELEEAI